MKFGVYYLHTCIGINKLIIFISKLVTNKMGQVGQKWGKKRKGGKQVKKWQKGKVGQKWKKKRESMFALVKPLFY